MKQNNPTGLRDFSLVLRLITQKSSKTVFPWSEIGRIHQKNVSCHPNPWECETQLGASIDHPPGAAHGHLPLEEISTPCRARFSQALEQATGLSFWNEGKKLAGRSASFLSFCFLPSCSQGADPERQPVLTDRLYVMFRSSLGPSLPGGSRGLARPPPADK